MNGLKLAQLLGQPCDFYARRYYEAQHGPHRADTSWGTLDRDEFEAIMETIAEQHRCGVPTRSESPWGGKYLIL
jgi:hypothetical protein